MESIKYDNHKWLWSNLKTQEEVNEVSDYLKDNNVEIKTDRLGERGGMQGKNVYLEGVRFGNGFCSIYDELLFHVRNYQNFINITETQEYSDYLDQKEKFEHVFKYINNR